MGCALGRSGGRRHRESGQLLSINFSPQGAPRRRLPRPTDAPLELVLRTPAGSVAGLGANAPTGYSGKSFRKGVVKEKRGKDVAII